MGALRLEVDKGCCACLRVERCALATKCTAVETGLYPTTSPDSVCSFHDAKEITFCKTLQMLLLLILRFQCTNEAVALFHAKNVSGAHLL